MPLSVFSTSFIFLFYLVIKEAAVLKKHNLFEDNLNLPCESVSSLTDLKTPSGSAQTTPAKKPSTTRMEASDTETQSEETLIVTEKILWDKDHEDRKPSDKEVVISVNMDGSQASKSEEVVITDISEKWESLSTTPTKQEFAEGNTPLENESMVKADSVGDTEKKLTTREEAVEEEVVSGTENTLRDVSPEKELKVHEGSVEEKVTSEKESKVQEDVEIELTSPPNKTAETEILGSAEMKIEIEKGVTEELSQSENEVGTGFEKDSKEKSKDQGASTEISVASQDEHTGKGASGDNPEKESKSEVKNCEPLDDVNEIRNLLMVTVELPADTPPEKVEEMCEAEIIKLQEDEWNNEISKTAVVEVQVSQTVVNKDAAECMEFKEGFSSSCGTDGTSVGNVSKVGRSVAQAEWLVEISDTPQEVKSEVEIKQSMWYTDAGGCDSDRLHPEEHTEHASEDKRLSGEEGGAGNSHAGLVEVGTECFSHKPAENPDATQVPILNTEEPRTGLVDAPFLSVAEPGEASAVQVTAGAEPDESKGKPEDESSSSHVEIKSSEVNNVFTQENREDSSVQQSPEE